MTLLLSRLTNTTKHFAMSIDYVLSGTKIPEFLKVCSASYALYQFQTFSLFLAIPMNLFHRIPYCHVLKTEKYISSILIILQSEDFFPLILDALLQTKQSSFLKIRRFLPCNKMLNEMEIYRFHLGNLKNETKKYSYVGVLVAC